MVGSNLAQRVRTLFLQAVLRREIEWSNLEGNMSGSLTTWLSIDVPEARGAVADVLAVLTCPP